jgi:hypothetical protein
MARLITVGCEFDFLFLRQAGRLTKLLDHRVLLGLRRRLLPVVCGSLFRLGFCNFHHNVRRLGQDILDIRGHTNSFCELNKPSSRVSARRSMMPITCAVPIVIRQ